MVVFDNSVLILLFDPDAFPPIDEKTGQSVKKAKERIEFLIANLEASKTKIIIPTPVSMLRIRL